MANEQNQYYVCTVEDTQKYGIVKAAILGRIRWWCEYNEKNNDKFHEEYYWSGWMSGSDFQEQIGLPSSTIYRNLEQLIEDGIIIKANFNKKSYDKTGWYRINLDSQNGNNISQNENHDSQNENNNSHNENGDSQNDNTIPVNPPVNQSENLALNKSVNVLHHNTGAVIKGWLLKGKIRKIMLDIFSPWFKTNMDVIVLLKWIEQGEYEHIVRRTKEPITDEQMQLLILFKDILIDEDYSTEELPELLVQNVN
jgi:hypothetical protein